MVTHLLDTSVYSQRLMRKPNPNVVARWKRLGDQALSISAICEAELLFGLEKKNSRRLWLEYDHYLKDRLSLIPLGRKEAIAFSKIKNRLRSQGKFVSDFDLLIGATAKANGLIIATVTINHFNVIEEVAAENWS